MMVILFQNNTGLAYIWYTRKEKKISNVTRLGEKTYNEGLKNKSKRKVIGKHKEGWLGINIDE